MLATSGHSASFRLPVRTCIRCLKRSSVVHGQNSCVLRLRYVGAALAQIEVCSREGGTYALLVGQVPTQLLHAVTTLDWYGLLFFHRHCRWSYFASESVRSCWVYRMCDLASLFLMILSRAAGAAHVSSPSFSSIFTYANLSLKGIAHAQSNLISSRTQQSRQNSDVLIRKTTWQGIVI